MRYPDPGEILSGELGDWLAELKSKRRKAKKTGLLRLAIALPMVALALYFFDFGLLGSITGGMIGAGIVYGWAQEPARDLMVDVKIEINAAIARAMDVEYIPFSNPNFAFECASYFGLVPAHDETAFEDHWRGEFEGRSFELIEAELKAWRESKNGHRHLSKVFDGTIVSITTNAPFKSATIVREKNPLRDWQENYLIKGPTSPHEVGMGEVELGNAEFDARFECFSEDMDEAKRLLTPKMISAISQLADLFGSGRDTSAVFHDGHFVMITNSGYLFEGHTHSPCYDYETVAGTIEQFARLLEAAKAV